MDAAVTLVGALVFSTASTIYSDYYIIMIYYNIKITKSFIDFTHERPFRITACCEPFTPIYVSALHIVRLIISPICVCHKAAICVEIRRRTGFFVARPACRSEYM